MKEKFDYFYTLTIVDNQLSTNRWQPYYPNYRTRSHRRRLLQRRLWRVSIRVARRFPFKSLATKSWPTLCDAENGRSVVVIKGCPRVTAQLCI